MPQRFTPHMGHAALMVVLSACGPKGSFDSNGFGSSDDGTSTASNSTTTQATTAQTTTDPDGSGEDGRPMTTSRAVDVLLVIDNSGSMGQVQARLANGVDGLVSVFEDPAAPVDYRIGVTTTDNGNPWCSSTSPEGGDLRLSSCLSRPTEFVSNAGSGTTDAFEVACADQCSLESINVQPSTAAVDDELRPRPWLEQIGGVTNLPEGVGMLEALRCVLPQGISGCGFEQPLESMYKAILRSETAGEDAYGFHRAGALLAIIFVSDEADCSYLTTHESIFLADGNRVFWSDPEASAPTSAVCWNAGVECVGNGSPYVECHSASYDVNGDLTTNEDDAVLRPVSRYIDLAPDVLVAGILGVPDGYGFGQVELEYRVAFNDSVFQTNFGIGPGCEQLDMDAGLVAQAVPPVRMREVIEAHSPERNLFSVCASSYSPTLGEIAQRIVDRLPQ